MRSASAMEDVPGVKLIGLTVQQTHSLRVPEILIEAINRGQS